MVASLERKGNLRLVICAVEAWSEVGDPPPSALLAQVRALSRFCAIDRAWARLSPLLEDTEDLEAYQVAGELLVDQGRIVDARRVLKRGMEHHGRDPVLKQLWARTDGLGTQIDLTEPNEHDVEARLRHVERLLREGNPIKAKRMLEAVRQDFPNHQRVIDLRWAIEGEFALRGVTLEDLVRVHAPRLAGISDEPEHTETGRQDLIDAALGDDDDGIHNFPSLFKGMGVGATLDKASLNEVTVASFDDDEEEPTSIDDDDVLPTDFEDHTEVEREDTQIMHVIRNDRDPTAADTLIDRSPAAADVPAGETEDEHVILRRKHQDAGEPELTVPHDDAPLRLDPARERVQDGAPTHDEGSAFVTMRAQTARPVEIPLSEADTAIEPQRERTPPPPPPARPSHEVPTEILDDPVTDSGELWKNEPVSWTAYLMLMIALFGLLIVGAVVFAAVQLATSL